MESLSARLETKQKQSQQLLLSLAMKQAFHVLQMPVVELREWLDLQIEQNPVLESLPEEHSSQEILSQTEENSSPNSTLDPDQHKQIKERHCYQETLWRYQISLFQHLMAQARLNFENPEELAIAETIIGSLDERGFLSPEISLQPAYRTIINTIQTFEPPGIAATSVRESLLIQLRLKQKETRLAYQIIEEHFDDLLQHRLLRIQKKLHCSADQLKQEISLHISPLDPHPGYRFISCPVPMITPDLFLYKQEDVWKIEINQEGLPRFTLAPLYQNYLKENQLNTPETNYIRKQIASGKWIHRIVSRRHQTLKAVAFAILKRQHLFLSGDQKILHPMSLQELSQELSLNESTIARAVANKYLFCPAGLFSIRSFFTHGVTTSDGEKVSNHTLRQILQELVRTENKLTPLSDSAISSHFREKGYPCARRTVAKYRKLLDIPPASKRKNQSTPK